MKSSKWRGSRKRCAIYQVSFALPAVAREAWPQIKGLELSVDAHNLAAMGLYLRAGWVDRGEAYKGRVGYERRLSFRFDP